MTKKQSLRSKHGSRHPPDRARGVLILMSPAEFRKCEAIAGADGVGAVGEETDTGGE